ncbi:MAG: hypothetical protein WBC70_16355, partial [Candidatus Aminicenantales bacterium]
PEYRISTRPSYHIAAYSFTHGQARGTLPFGLLEYDLREVKFEYIEKLIGKLGLKLSQKLF